jgi:hypothetical protein
MTTIKDSQFYGVKWDEPSLNVLKDVSKALLNLTELFKGQNVTIDSLLRITAPQAVEEPPKKPAKKKTPTRRAK